MERGVVGRSEWNKKRAGEDAGKKVGRGERKGMRNRQGVGRRREARRESWESEMLRSRLE